MIIDRRKALSIGGKILIFPLAASLLPEKVSALKNPNSDTKQITNSGFLKIKGRVFLNGYPVSMGQGLYGMSKFVVPQNAELIFYTPDQSIFRIKGNSVIDINFRSTFAGVITVIQGSITSVIPLGITVPYILKTETMGIRLLSSVTYFQRTSDTEAYTDEKGAPVKFDKKADYYLCLCNGHADFLSLERKRNLRILESKYHESMFITETNKKLVIEKYQRINHTDLDLYNQITLNKVQPYDTSWLNV